MGTTDGGLGVTVQYDDLSVATLPLSLETEPLLERLAGSIRAIELTQVDLAA